MKKTDFLTVVNDGIQVLHSNFKFFKDDIKIYFRLECPETS